MGWVITSLDEDVFEKEKERENVGGEGRERRGEERSGEEEERKEGKEERGEEEKKGREQEVE